MVLQVILVFYHSKVKCINMNSTLNTHKMRYVCLNSNFTQTKAAKEAALKKGIQCL